MENIFEQKIKAKTNEELIDIFINSKDYQPAFIDAVEVEILKREIPIDSLKETREEKDIDDFIKYATTSYENDSLSSPDNIKAALIAQGADEELASSIVQEVEQSLKKERLSKAKASIIGGISILLIGIYLTVKSYMNTEVGGYYSIYWYAILVGFSALVIGIIFKKRTEKKSYRK